MTPWRANVVLDRHPSLDVVVTAEEVVIHNSWIFTEKHVLINALETWLANWDREFAYHDRQAAKMRWPNA